MQNTSVFRLKGLLLLILSIKDLSWKVGIFSQSLNYEFMGWHCEKSCDSHTYSPHQMWEKLLWSRHFVNPTPFISTLLWLALGKGLCCCGCFSGFVCCAQVRRFFHQLWEKNKNLENSAIFTLSESNLRNR